MQRIRIKKTADYTPLGKGFAAITIQGGNLPIDSPNLYIRRSGYSDSELGPAGWQASEYPIKPRESNAVEGGVDYVVGPDVVGYLERGNYHLFIELPGSADRLTGVMTWRNVTPCAPPDANARSGGRLGELKAGESTPSVPKPGPVSPPKPVDPPETSEPQDDTLPPPPKPKWPIYVAVALLLAIAAVGGYLILNQLEPIPEETSPVIDVPDSPKEDSPTDETPIPEPETQPETSPKLEKETPAPELTPTPKPVTETAPDWRNYVDASADEQYQLGKSLQEQAITKGGDGELLTQAERFFDLAGAQGHAEAIRQRAALFDPRVLTPERAGQIDADVRTAYNQYRRALEAGSTEARADLEKLKLEVERMAADGDYDALRVLRRWKE